MILAKHYKKFVGGGNTMSNIGFGTDLIGGIADASNPDGTNSLASALGSGAKFAGLGAQVAGPIGAGVGAVLGAGVSLLSAGKRKREALTKKNKDIALGRRTMDEYSAAQIGANPELMNGSLSAGYFKYGGSFTENPIPETRAIRARPSLEELNMRKDQFLSDKPMDTYQHWGGMQGVSKKGTERKWFDNNLNYLINNNMESNNYHDRFSHYSINMDPKQPMTMAKNGGSLSAAYLGKAQNGGLISRSSDGAEVYGPSHANGGVKFPAAGVELEGGETVKGDYVFSKELGFAKLHRPLLRAKEKIGGKPLTQDRVNSMQLIEAQEKKLKSAQEYIRQILNKA